MAVISEKKLLFGVFISFFTVSSANAIQLPEERADASYHSYSGGGVDVSGPALLVRKNIEQTYSITAGFHIDDITNASVDAVTQASAYTEQRTEINTGFDYQIDDAIISLSWIASDENDYESSLYGFSIAQEVFGGMTVISLGYARGFDNVGRIDTEFDEEIDRHQFKASWKQILSPRWVLNTQYELMDDQGYLANPYRAALQNCAFGDQIVCAAVPEVYPETRTSHAISFTNLYYLGNDSVFRSDYRFFTDTWAIDAHEFEASLSTQMINNFTLEASYRFYTQSAANFYFDNATQDTNFISRDKELSQFIGHSIGFDIEYELLAPEEYDIDSLTLGVSYDFVFHDYDNFTDIRTGVLYTLEATVLQVFLSAVF
ncbi:MAG: DUF3570 domain-containing protein [Pseudomonadota bacterium]